MLIHTGASSSFSCQSKLNDAIVADERAYTRSTLSVSSTSIVAGSGGEGGDGGDGDGDEPGLASMHSPGNPPACVACFTREGKCAGVFGVCVCVSGCEESCMQ